MNFSVALPFFVLFCWTLCLTSSRAQPPTSADSARAQAVNDRAWDLRRQGKLDAALSLMDSASILAQSLNIHNYYVNAKRRMVFIHLGNGAYDRAQALATQTIREAKELEGPNSVNESKLYGLLGQAYSRQGNHTKGLVYFQRAIAVADARGDEALRANHLLGLGAVYYLLGNFEGALAAYKRYEIHFLENGKAHLLSPIYNNSAALYHQLGDLEEALQYALSALELEKRRPEKEWMSLRRSYRNIAVILQRLDRPHKALEYYDLADEITRIQFDNAPQQVVESMALRASLYSLLEEWREALGVLRREYALRTSLEKGQLMSEAFALNHVNLGVAYFELGQYNRVAPILKPVLDHRPDFKDIAVAYQLMMKVAFKQNDQKQGRMWAQRAIDFSEKRYGTQHRYSAEIYLDLANLYWEMGNPIDTVDAYADLGIRRLMMNDQQSIAENIKEGTYREVNILLQVLSEKANWYFELYLRTRKPHYLSAVAAELDLANKVLERQLRDGLSNEDKQYKVAKYQLVYEQTVKLHHWRTTGNHQGADLTAVLQAMENNKSVLLADVLQGQQAQRISGIPDSLLAQKKKQLQQIEQLKKEQIEVQKYPESQRKGPQLRAQVATAQEALQTFEEQLVKDYPFYAQLLQKESNLDLTQVRRDLLDDKTALIEFLVSDSTIYQLVVTHQTARLYDLTVTKKELDQQIANFRKALTDYTFIDRQAMTGAYDLYHKTGRWLYEHLLAQALEPLVGIEELIIVPDYKLGHLPFEVFLVTPQEEARSYQTLDYLLQHYVVRYGYSAQLLLGKQRPSTNRQKRLLTMAGSYGETKDSSWLWQRSLQQQHLRSELQPLPAALEEALTLAQSYPNAHAWTEGAASERAFKENAADYDILHLAMHGLLNTQHPMLSAMVFTETGDSSEDNFLYAYEIAQMDLKAQLVVLSACETGYGKFEQGEGVLSLARSFMYAGVPSTVVSLWQVNDYSTSIIMEHFYRQLRAGKPTAEALTLAKRQYLQEANMPITHPVYWASFVSIGQSTVVSTPGLGWGWWSAIVGGAVLLVGLGIRQWRRRAIGEGIQ